MSSSGVFHGLVGLSLIVQFITASSLIGTPPQALFPNTTSSSLLSATSPRADVPDICRNRVQGVGPGSQRVIEEIEYRFQRQSMSDDSISFATFESLYTLGMLLDKAAGNQTHTAPTLDLRLQRPGYYDFEIGLDLYADNEEFTLWRLRALFLDIIQLGKKYYLRECDIIYRTNGRVLLTGYLKNGEGQTPSRSSPQDPFTYYLNSPPRTVQYFSYNGRLSLTGVMSIAYKILAIAWEAMVQGRRSSQYIFLPNNRFETTEGGIRLAMAASVDRLRLADLLTAAYAFATFGRLYNMQSISLRMMSPGRPGQVVGLVAKDRGLFNSSLTAAQ